MTRKTVTTPVKDGSVTREERTGRFVEVRLSGGASRGSAKTQGILASASSRREAALKRLADR